jgi:hypothetical protein
MWLANKLNGLKALWKFDNRYQLDLLHSEMLDLGNLNHNALSLTSPCFGVAETPLSLRKERDVAERQGEVTVTSLA